MSCTEYNSKLILQTFSGQKTHWKQQYSIRSYWGLRLPSIAWAILVCGMNYLVQNI